MPEGNNKVKNRIEELKNKRASQPTKAEMDKQIEEMERNTYTKNLDHLKQFETYEDKLMGNAKLNEDEYNRKKGRMKVILPTYEWEKDEINVQIEEKKLQSVYEDTKKNIALELDKLNQSRKNITDQQARVLERFPQFKDIKIDVEELTKELDEKTKTWKPKQ